MNRILTRGLATKARFSMDQAGLAFDLYVPPKQKPSIFQPKQWWTLFKRRMRVFGMNTYMAVVLRREIGRDRFQPLAWKELAILLYKRTNESFVKRDVNALQVLTSRWVYGPLSERMQKLPSDYRFGWKLLRFNSRPKVLSLLPITMGDEPTRFVQLLYRFESTQELTKVRKGTTDVQKVQRNVVDNVAFIVDTLKQPPEARLIGSLFETPVAAPMPDPTLLPRSRDVLMHGMSVRGDIFRPQPEYAAVKAP